MPQAPPCPSPRDLLRLTLGQAPESEAEALGQHLLSCSRCADTLNNLRAEDPLIDALRGSRDAILADPPVVEALMKRLVGTPPAIILRGSTVLPTAEDDVPRQIGRYQILGRLGAGGMGTVYRAHDPQLRRDVALKVPRFSGAAETIERASQRFLHEARAAAAVRHPHVCPIYDVGEQEGRPFVVMALVEGESLAERLKQGVAEDCREAIALVGQVAEALTAVHAAGLVHRDLKPGNILLDRAGQALLTDFGLASAVEEKIHLTQTGVLVGTPAYMAPEQARGAEVDPRCDLFSLGVVLYQMVTGRLPFQGESAMALLSALALDTPPAPKELNTAHPAGLSDLVMRLLAKKPEERPASAKAVAEELIALERTLSQTGVPAPASTGQGPETARLVPTLRRRRWGWVAVAAVLALGVLLGIAMKMPPWTERKPPALSDRLHVRSLAVNLLAREMHDGKWHVDSRGVLGKDVFSARLGDQVTVEANLDQQAYAYLLAYRTDGVEELCFPESADEAPPLLDRPRYPWKKVGNRYGLSDGPGLQAFTVVASSQPLPPYREWQARRGPALWGKYSGPRNVVWICDGVGPALARTPHGAAQRGKDEPASEDELALVRLAEQLRQAEGIETVEVVGFGVSQPKN